MKSCIECICYVQQTEVHIALVNYARSMGYPVELLLTLLLPGSEIRTGPPIVIVTPATGAPVDVPYAVSAELIVSPAIPDPSLRRKLRYNRSEVIKRRDLPFAPCILPPLVALPVALLPVEAETMGTVAAAVIVAAAANSCWRLFS